MTRYQDINNQMTDLNIDEEENEKFTFEGDVKEAIDKYDPCLVGRFLTEKNLNKCQGHADKASRRVETNDGNKY